MDEGVLVQLDEEEEHLELENLGGHRLDDFAYDDDDSEGDEDLMNEGSFLLSDTRRFAANRRRETAMSLSDMESGDESAAGGGARNNRRRPDLR